MFKRSMIMIFLVVSCFLPIICQNAFAGSLPIRFGSVQEIEKYFGGPITFYDQDGYPVSDTLVSDTLQGQAIYARGPFGVRSTSGFDDIVVRNGQNNKFRVRYALLLANNWGDFTNNTFLLSVARGQTKKISKEVQLCNTVTISGQVSGGYLGVINNQITATTSSTRCDKVTTEQDFIFPADDATCTGNSRSFYAAMVRDHYQIESNWVPYYRDQSGFDLCYERCRGNYIISNDDDSNIGVDCYNMCNASYPLTWHWSNELVETGYWNEPILIIYSVCNTVPTPR